MPASGVAPGAFSALLASMKVATGLCQSLDGTTTATGSTPASSGFCTFQSLHLFNRIKR